MAVEKLVAPKFAKIKSRQDALQTTFSVFLDIFYPLNLAVLDEKGVFRQPLPISLIDPSVQSAHGLLETDFGRTLRFRNHLPLLSDVDSNGGHISR